MEFGLLRICEHNLRKIQVDGNAGPYQVGGHYRYGITIVRLVDLVEKGG